MMPLEMVSVSGGQYQRRSPSPPDCSQPLADMMETEAAPMPGRVAPTLEYEPAVASSPVSSRSETAAWPALFAASVETWETSALASVLFTPVVAVPAHPASAASAVVALMAA